MLRSTKRAKVTGLLAAAIVLSVSALAVYSSVSLTSSSTDSRSYAAPASKTGAGLRRAACDWNGDGRSDCNQYTQVCVNNRCVDNGNDTGIPCDWNADGVGPDCNPLTQECAADGSRCLPTSCDWNGDGQSDCNRYTQTCQNGRCISNGNETGVPCDWNADGIGPDCNPKTQFCDGTRCVTRKNSVGPIETAIPIPSVGPVYR